MRSVFMVAALVAWVVPIAAPAQSSANAVRLTGTVVSVEAKSAVVRTDSGEQTITFGPAVRFLSLSKSSLEKVTQNAFIGTTVVPEPDNTYVSTEVHIFAPSLRGTGEGFTRMDSSGKHMMANSTVKTVARPTNMMANSSVQTVASNAGQKKITMVFPSGTIHVTIPPSTPVTYIEPASRSMLVPGAHVLVLGARGSSGIEAKTFVIAQHGASLM